MDLELTSDQTSIVEAIDKLAAPFRQAPAGSQAPLLESTSLDDKLQDGGFRDIARFEGMGALDAVLVAEIVLGLPYAVEYAASAIVASRFDIEVTGPVALVCEPFGAPVRFLQAGGTALILDGEDVRILPLAKDRVEQIQAPFAYPVGRFTHTDLAGATVIKGASRRLRQWWYVALAVEIGATAKAAVEFTTQYVTQRRQFGRPIGSYQAVQHRLSACMVLAQSIRLLSRRAAALDDEQAALVAMVHAKEACPQIIYDTHQFNGAIGLTYEHPLHFFTYRLRLLHGELSSLTELGDMLADSRWASEPADWNE